MIPVKTSVEDIQKVLSYMSRQVGWVETAKAEKALGALDDRKLSAMVEFGLILRDGANLKTTPRGQLFSAGKQEESLREVLNRVDLYRATLEWVHYSSKDEVTATEVGQYWESSHADTLGTLSGTTLKDGAVCFGRIVAGAGLGVFTVGRGGKETRISLHLAEVAALVNGSSNDGPASVVEPGEEGGDELEGSVQIVTGSTMSSGADSPTAKVAPVSVTTSPNVHVNVEIHIAANATPETVRDVFKNMARYVLDRPISDDID